jgi:hypothetical protein
MTALLTREELSIYDFGRGFGMDTHSSKAMAETCADLQKVQGTALIIGGLAVIHHGYKRFTEDVDIIYPNHDEADILRRLKKDFKTVIKAKSGWHHLEHRKTKVRLELIPEGGLGTYGFIPGPKILGNDGGFVSLKGLIWLKLISGRMQDLADIVILAKQRMKVLRQLKKELPQEFHGRYEELLLQAQRELDTDPDPNSLIGGRVREAPAQYGKRKRRKVSIA